MSGIDIGINFLHEYLALNDVKKRVGVVMMDPCSFNERTCSFKSNKDRSKVQSDDIAKAREGGVKVRRQFSRMGFKVVQDSPEYVNKWYLGMRDAGYKTQPKEYIKSAWMTKEQASQIHIPMKPAPHVDTEEDKELKSLLRSLCPDSGGEIFPGASSTMSDIMSSLNEINALLGRGIMHPAQRNSSKLTDVLKCYLKRLVKNGASLEGIDALHMAASKYKNEDLFDLLIGTYNMRVDAFDNGGSMPLHVAACCGNPEGVKILLARGANKQALNKDGKNALECVQEQEKSHNDFGAIMGMSSSPADPNVQAVMALLV